MRKLRRDQTIIERAKVVHARQALQFADWPFVREWDELLALPAADLVTKLMSRDHEMVRLRNSSPFYLVDDLRFTHYNTRIRISRAAGSLRAVVGRMGPNYLAIEWRKRRRWRRRHAAAAAGLGGSGPE